MRVRSSLFASTLLLSLGVSGMGVHFDTGTLDALRSAAGAADPCRVAPSAVLDPVSAYFAALDRAATQAFDMGNTTCLGRLATGAEQARSLQQVRAQRAAYPGAQLQVHSAVASAAVLGDPQSTNCSTLQVVAYQDTAYVRPGTAARHTLTVRRYTLRNLTPAAPNSFPNPLTAVYVATASQPIAPAPLPGGAAGPFASTFANAVNRYLITSPGAFGQMLTPAHVQAIARTGFVLDSRSGHNNFFGVEGGQGSDSYYNNVASSIPSFVTLDAGLHTFHVLFDRTLMTAESISLEPRLGALLAGLAQANVAQHTRLTAPAALAANEANAAYLAVPIRLLGGSEPSGSLSPAEAGIVAQEVALIRAHAAQTRSPFLEKAFDYRLFKPRGHYTYGPELESYFEAMNWLALAQAPLEAPAHSGVSPAQARAGALRAMLMAALMGGLTKGLLGQWHRLADPITTLIGAPAGPTLTDVVALTRRVYGAAAPSTSALQNPALLTRFLSLVPTLPAVPYRSTSSTGSFKIRGFGLFPARAIADGTLAAALTWPNVGTQAHPRTLPAGLDVMAVLGSPRAARLAQQAGPWPNYAAALTKAKPAFDQALRAPTLYAQWLAALQPLAQPMPGAAPPVMHTAAWDDKELMTGLASWSELRHDSILYASQAGGGGAGGFCSAPALFRYGYVEPIPAAWQRLAALADRLAALTRAYGLFDGLPAATRAALLAAEDRYRGGLRALGAIAVAELRHRPLGPAQALLVNDAAPVLGQPMSVFFAQTPHPMSDPTSTQAAEIADVATDLVSGAVLEAGEGQVRDLWVLVPIDGFTWLMRGEVYTYYEFTTNGQRLSDQQWQRKVDIYPGQPTTVHEPAWIEAITR